MANSVVLVLDNGPVQTSVALTARSSTTVERPPLVAIQLNEIELGWRYLKRHHLAHRTFHNSAILDAAIHGATKILARNTSVIIRVTDRESLIKLSAKLGGRRILMCGVSSPT